jgi:hypothetical protein
LYSITASVGVCVYSTTVSVGVCSRARTQRLLVSLEAALRCPLLSPPPAGSAAAGLSWEVSGEERLAVRDRLEACLAALEDAEPAAGGGGGAADVLTDPDGDDPCEVSRPYRPQCV